MSPTDPAPDRTAAQVSRRALIGAVATGGLLATGTSFAHAVEEPTPVRTLDGAETATLVERARQDRQVAVLADELAADGWEPDPDGAIAHRTDVEDHPTHHTVAIPFHRGEAEAVVLWTDAGPFPTQSRRYVQQADGSVEVEATMFTDDGRVDAADIIPPERLDLFCWSLNWTCVLSVAGAWASAIATCAVCVIDPSKLTCLACIGAVLSATGGTIGCDFC